MTINKIATSALAATLLTTASFAGTMTATSQTVGAESTASAMRYFNNLDMNSSYTVSILGTLNQGSVIYTISGVDLNRTSGFASELSVYDVTSDRNITSSCANGSAGQIICDINDTITSGDVLTLVNKTAALQSTSGAKIDVNTSAGFSSATVSVQLTNSATTQIDSAPATAFLTATTEWTAGTTTGFANKIDASNSFLSFNSSYDANASVVITHNSVGIASPAGTLNWSIMPDRNTSAFGTMNMTGAATQGADNNYTSGTVVLPTAATTTLYADFTPNGTSTLEEASFTTTLTGVVNSNTVTLIAADTSFGAFTTYGYNGFIPGASYSANTDTVITLVNNQETATAETSIVIYDATGNTCTLTSGTDTEVTKPTANSSTKYTLSTMLGNASCSALTGTSYSIKVILPTTPTNVYANAFVKNSAINQFKVLPVYNNGTSY